MVMSVATLEHEITVVMVSHDHRYDCLRRWTVSGANMCLTTITGIATTGWRSVQFDFGLGDAQEQSVAQLEGIGEQTAQPKAAKRSAVYNGKVGEG